MMVCASHSVLRMVLLVMMVFAWSGSAFNCLVARLHHVQEASQLAEWRGCLARWQAADQTDNGSVIAAGDLKRCGERTWFSNLHSWHSIRGCLETCSPCLERAISVGADAVTCYERVHIPPFEARCMLGYNPKPRLHMRRMLCNQADETHEACHVDPFIPGGHYEDLAAPGAKEPALGEVVDLGCTLQRGLCMNWPLNGMTPQFVPIGGTETPGDKRHLNESDVPETHGPPVHKQYTGEWMP